MNIANIYRKLKQILNDCNVALAGRGLSRVDSFNTIPSEINKLGEINRLPYFLQYDVVELREEDLDGFTSITESNWGRYNFVRVFIPNSVTSIGNDALYGCNSITDIYVNSTTPPNLSSVRSIPFDSIIHVPIGSGEVYKSATNWSAYAEKIVEDIVMN